MSREPSQAAGLERPVEGLEMLVEYFRSGEKTRERWRVGTEHEKIGLYAEDQRPVPYEGEGGIEVLLARIAEQTGWRLVLENGRAIALEDGTASITLEPGGQLELSGVPLSSISETCSEFREHLALMKRVSAPLGIVWLGLGIHPLHSLEQIPRMPKARYRVMHDYFAQRGHSNLGLDMMHTTATVQANFDFSSEADMAAKMRMAVSVTPIVSAIFANSSLSEGKPNGFVSKRVHIWTRTDSERTGILDFTLQPEFGYANYAEWALDVPMFFIVRDGNYVPMQRMSFRRFVSEGYQGQRALLRDWDLHLTTLFPEVRLKRVLEVRGADAVPPGLTCSLPALWKGLLYDEGALAAATELMAGAQAEVLQAALHDVARRGLAAEIGGRRALDLARELVAMADAGLRRIRAERAGSSDESAFLDSIREQLEMGKSPGQVVLERWEGEWGRSPQRLIEYARY